MQTQILNKIQFALFEQTLPLSLCVSLSVFLALMSCLFLACCCCSFNLKMLENNASWQRGNSRPMTRDEDEVGAGAEAGVRLGVGGW